MATAGINPNLPYQLNLPNQPTYRSDDQELNIEFRRIYDAIKLMSLHLVPPGVTAGFVLTDGGPGTTPTWQPGGGSSGGLTLGQVEALFLLVPSFL